MEANHISERIAALTEFKTMHGHLKVPQNYVIPVDSEYSEQLWGMKLGMFVVGIRREGNYASMKPIFEELGVDFHVKKRQPRIDFALVESAVQAFKSVHGDANFASTYAIPQGDARFPKQLWGFELGDRAYNIVVEGSEAKKQRLLELGVREFGRTFEPVLEAAEAYNSINGHLIVPVRYVIPIDDERYPEAFRGMRLGAKLRDIRSSSPREGTQAAVRKQQLLVMGMPENGIIGNAKFQCVLDAVEVFKTIHGHVKVPRTYVVPEDDDRYPEECRELPLGKRVKWYHSKEARPECRQRLRELGVEEPLDGGLGDDSPVSSPRGHETRVRKVARRTEY